MKQSVQKHFSNLQLMKRAQMIEPSLFENCQRLIKKDLGSWKSYFSKWEVFAKYEENVLESELLDEPFDKVKSVKKKKVKQLPSKNNLKKMSLLTVRKNQKCQKKNVKRTRVFPKSKVISKSNSKNKVIQKHCNFKLDKIVVDPINYRMETTLKSVFTKYLRADINNSEVFTVLSQTYSDRERIDSTQLFSKCQQALTCNELQPNERCLIMKHHVLPSAMSSVNTLSKSICPDRNEYIESLKSLNFFSFNAKSVIDNEKLQSTGNLVFGNSLPYEFCCKRDKNQQYFWGSACNNTILQQTIQTNFNIKASHLAFFDNHKYQNAKLKQFKFDCSPISPTSIFGKINKKYIIKKAFPKMNITQDEKRFENLCLRERTNSVSLSMENSNFVTPERKPSERKCFSENVLHRKRGHLSKLFFDNEEEDSESDDQTQNKAPLIYSENKIKTQIISKFMDSESDSDDCESIFDKVKKP